MMKNQYYTVEMVMNPDKPCVAYWMYDELDKAKETFEELKKGMTARHVTVHLTGPDGNHIEAAKLGDEVKEPKTIQPEYFKYEDRRSVDYQSMSTGPIDLLIID